MPTIINTTDNKFLEQFGELLNNDRNVSGDLQETVKNILQDVKTHGDESVIKYTNQFDKNSLSIEDIIVSEDGCFGYDLRGEHWST